MGKKEHRILCVEDNADNQVLLKFYLKNEPYNLTFAEDGFLAKKLLDKGYFDLFLVDLNLPNGMNGFDVAREIRQDDRHGSKPIVVITAFSRADMNEPLSLHIDKILTKPLYKGEFIDTLELFLKN